MLLFLTASARFSRRMLAGAGSGSTTPVATTAMLNGHHGFYFRDGIWLADAKTLVNMVRYLLERDPMATTNVVANG